MSGINLKLRFNTIIAGYFGMGKTTASKNDPDRFIDIRYQEYMYVRGGANNEILRTNLLDPSWPMNYVNALQSACKDNPNSIILCSTHTEVLDELSRRDLSFIAIAPKNKSFILRNNKDTKLFRFQYP